MPKWPAITYAMAPNQASWNGCYNKTRPYHTVTYNETLREGRHNPPHPPHHARSCLTALHRTPPRRTCCDSRHAPVGCRRLLPRCCWRLCCLWGRSGRMRRTAACCCPSGPVGCVAALCCRQHCARHCSSLTLKRHHSNSSTQQQQWQQPSMPRQHSNMQLGCDHSPALFSMHVHACASGATFAASSTSSAYTHTHGMRLAASLSEICAAMQ